MKIESMVTQAIVAIAIVAVLVSVALFYRTKAEIVARERDQWRNTAETFEAANRKNVVTLELYKRAAIQNAALAEAQAERLKAIDEASDATRNRIREAIRNDPQASDWASSLVPVSVRDATRH